MQKILEQKILDFLSCMESQNIKTSWKPDDFFLDKTSLYLSLLKKWNASHDLVAPGEIEDFILPHILDSIASTIVLAESDQIPSFNTKHPFSFADIGSGAGLPGIPWHIWYGDKATSFLVEPRRKRCSFLKTVQAELGLKNMKVIEGRSEALQAHTNSINAIVLRALKPDREIMKSFSKFDSTSVFWLAGPNTDEDESWKMVAEYSLVKSGEHKRKILLSGSTLV